MGHGIKAADGSRDDYKGLDVRGRLLVMLVGDRKAGTPMPLCCEPENLYGRWTHKFEEARRRGAAGVLLVHTDASAGYGWAVVRNGWVQERFQREGTGQAGAMQGWITEAMAIRLFALAGRDFRAGVLGAGRSGPLSSGSFWGRARRIRQYPTRQKTTEAASGGWVLSSEPTAGAACAPHAA